MTIPKCSTFTTIPVVLLVAFVLLVRTASAQENAGATRSRDQINETIVSAAMRHQLNSSDGKYIEFELAVMKEHRHRGRTAQDIEETITTLRRNRSAGSGTDEPRSLVGVEIGVAAGLPWLHGGVSATWQTEIPANGGQLMKPSIIQQPPQLLTRHGEPLQTFDDLTDPAVLQVHYDALENGTDQLPDDMRQALRRAAVNEHIRLYEHDPEYAAVSDRLFDGGRLPRPTADPETVMGAYPEFAGRFRIKELLDFARQSEKGDKEALKSLEERAIADIATLADATLADAIPASKADDRASKADMENLSASVDQAIDLVGHFDPVLGNQFRAVKNTVTGVSSAIDTFKTTTAAGGNKVFASANFTLSVANMGAQVFSALLGVETPHQQVMAELRKVQEAIQEMRREMHDRFDEVLDETAKGFELLSRGQDAIRADISLVAGELGIQRELIYEIARKVINLQWMVFLGANRIEDKIDTNSLVERRCIRVDEYDEDLDENGYRECVNILGAMIGHPDHPADDRIFGSGLRRNQLSKENSGLLAGPGDVESESGLTLAMRRLAEALGRSKPASLPDEVVGYRTLLDARNLVHRFLLDNPKRTSIERENTSFWKDGFSNARMFRGIEAYERNLANLIEVIQQEVTAFQAGEPSAIDAMLESMRTTVRDIRDNFRSTVDSFYAGKIPIDDADWAEGRPVPEWIEVVQDGNCYDHLIRPATKLDAARLLMPFVHQRDLRPARGGYGRIEVCVRTQNKKIASSRARSGAPARWIELQLAIDYRPEVACGGKDTIRLHKFKVAPVVTAVWQSRVVRNPGYDNSTGRGRERAESPTVWRMVPVETGAGRDRDGLTIRGTRSIVDWFRQRQQRQRLPSECWYQNVVTQAVEALEEERLEEEWRLLRREILAGEEIGGKIRHADEELEQELTHLRNLLFTAYQFFPLYDDAARELDAISLEDLVETGPPWNALDRAEIGIDRIGAWLRSDRMQSFTRTNRLHIRPVADVGSEM